jgi:hypothetical protein
MALPEQIRAEIEASFTGGPEPPSVADALAAGQRLLRRRRISTAAASVTVLGVLVVRVAMAAVLHRARSRRPPTQDQP